MAEAKEPVTLGWRWANDRWLSHGGVLLRYDKLEHFLVYLTLTYVVGVLFLTPLHTALVLFAVGLVWEIKDALVPYENVGFWGGDGFSWKDLSANILGIFLGQQAILLIHNNWITAMTS